MRDLPGKRVVLRPLSEADASVLRAIHSTPEVTTLWGSTGDDFPLSDDPDATRFTIVCGEEIAGLIQYGEELEPDYGTPGSTSSSTLPGSGEGWAPTRSPRSSATSSKNAGTIGSRRRQRGCNSLLPECRLSVRRRHGGGVARLRHRAVARRPPDGARRQATRAGTGEVTPTTTASGAREEQ